MNDPNEPMEDQVKRLEAELLRLKVERDKHKTFASTQGTKGWEGLTQHEYDAAMRNTGVLERVLAQLERDARGE